MKATTLLFIIFSVFLFNLNPVSGATVNGKELTGEQLVAKYGMFGKCLRDCDHAILHHTPSCINNCFSKYYHL